MREHAHSDITQPGLANLKRAEPGRRPGPADSEAKGPRAAAACVPPSGGAGVTAADFPIGTGESAGRLKWAFRWEVCHTCPAHRAQAQSTRMGCSAAASAAG